jgi:sugar phosphate isomerase/epimerase
LQEKIMIKSGLVSVSFRELSVEKILSMCERAQLECIEWGGDVHVVHGNIALAEKVAKMSANAGIEIASYGSYYFAGFSETSSKKPLFFQKVLDSAVALESKVIRVWAGHQVNSTEIGDEQRKIIVDDLLRIGEMAAKQDIAIGMEFHGGTLTDCNESAVRLKQELPDDSNVNFYWQTHLDYNDDQCLEGIKALAFRINNIHVSNWTKIEEGKYTQHLLETRKGPWIKFLSEIIKDGKNHSAMLEFILDNSEENFYKDVAVLKQIISKLSYARLK